MPMRDIVVVEDNRTELAEICILNNRKSNYFSRDSLTYEIMYYEYESEYEMMIRLDVNDILKTLSGK